MYATMYMATYEVICVTAISATKFRQNLFGYLAETINFNTPLHITTKDGSAVVISETDYTAMKETMYLSSIPGLKEDLTSSMNTP
jgi:PHD/YefM family antitoxin component YafN of YafNO toxin-antitoxin module